MADDNNTAAAADAAQPQFAIQRVYLKEASIEQPNSPAIFLEQEAPAVDIQLGVEANPLVDGVYEVCVSGTVTAKIKDKTLFLVECKQGGIFEIRGLGSEQVKQLIAVACPQIVYPYLRGNIADLIQRAGFPPVHLTEINFQAMFEANQAQEAAGTAATESSKLN